MKSMKKKTKSQNSWELKDSGFSCGIPPCPSADLTFPANKKPSKVNKTFAVIFRKQIVITVL